MSKERKYTKLFKIKSEYIWAELIESDCAITDLARKYNVHPAILGRLLSGQQRYVRINTLDKLLKGLSLDCGNPDDRAKLIVE